MIMTGSPWIFRLMLDYHTPTPTPRAPLADCAEVRTQLAEIQQQYLGEYRLVYEGYDIICHSVQYSIVFDNPAEHTAFILRYQ